MTSQACLTSKFPVGSSAIKILGCRTIALAIATRCLSPPDSSIGIRFSLPFKLTISKTLGIVYLISRLKTWRDFQNNLNDLEELAKLKDDSLLDELSRNLAISQKQFDQLSKQLKFDQPYDDHDVIMSIFAGAGGVDAQDWTAMLFRMYTRFFEIKHYQFNVISQTIGDEAGLKSVSIEVQGQQIYGN